MKSIIIFLLIFSVNQFNAQEIRLFSIDQHSDFSIKNIKPEDLRAPKDSLLQFKFNVLVGENTVIRFIISDSILQAGPEKIKELNDFLILLVISPDNKILRSLYYNLDNAEYPDCNVLYSKSLITLRQKKIKLKKLKLVPYTFPKSEYECIPEEYSKISKKHLKLPLAW